MKSLPTWLIGGVLKGGVAVVAVLAALVAYVLILIRILDAQASFGGIGGAVGALLRACLGMQTAVTLGEGSAQAVFSHSGIALGMVVLLVLFLIAIAPKRPAEMHAFFAFVGVTLFALSFFLGSHESSALGLFFGAATLAVVGAVLVYWLPRASASSPWVRVAATGLWSFLVIWLLASGIGLMFGIATLDLRSSVLVLAWFPFIAPNTGLSLVQSALGQPVRVVVQPTQDGLEFLSLGQNLTSISDWLNIPSIIMSLGFLLILAGIVMWQSIGVAAKCEKVASLEVGLATFISGFALAVLASLTFPLTAWSAAFQGQPTSAFAANFAVQMTSGEGATWTTSFLATIAATFLATVFSLWLASMQRKRDSTTVTDERLMTSTPR